MINKLGGTRLSVNDVIISDGFFRHLFYDQLVGRFSSRRLVNNTVCRIGDNLGDFECAKNVGVIFHEFILGHWKVQFHRIVNIRCIVNILLHIISVQRRHLSCFWNVKLFFCKIKNNNFHSICNNFKLFIWSRKRFFSEFIK